MTLREYSAGWDPGSGPPRELGGVQRRIDQQLGGSEESPVRLMDVRESGERRRGGEHLLEFLTEWPAREGEDETDKTWERETTLSKFKGWKRQGELWTAAEALKQRTETDLREAWRGDWETAADIWGMEPAVPQAVAPFNLADAIDHGVGGARWQGLRTRIGDADAEGDVQRVGAIMELWARRKAQPHELKGASFLAAARQEVRELRWEADERQQLFLGEVRSAVDLGRPTCSRTDP